MRLPEGIVVDKEGTFGVLKFSALRREAVMQNEDGTMGTEIKKRTYDIKSSGQKKMIQVSLPASVSLREINYNAVVELSNPEVFTVATATFQGADVKWYVTADDIVLKKQAANNEPLPGNPQKPAEQGQNKK